MSRRNFLKNVCLLGGGYVLAPIKSRWDSVEEMACCADGKRIGIIGLDTSHSAEFSKALNKDSTGRYLGYRVTAAYPYGSKTIQSSFSRIPAFTETVKALGVDIVPSIEELLSNVDCVLLETTDGHLHKKQAESVFRTGKKVFIDKPLGANMAEVKEIVALANKYRCPFFTSSALRYIPALQDIRFAGKYGRVLGADSFSPCTLEPTHEDLYWYGVHGVEMLFTAMGTGCLEVRFAGSENSELGVGRWSDGRIGVFRGMRGSFNSFGGNAYCEQGVIPMGGYDGYGRLLEHVVEFFESGLAPVTQEETLEIYAFMSAYQKSKHSDGIWVSLKDV